MSHKQEVPRTYENLETVAIQANKNNLDKIIVNTRVGVGNTIIGIEEDGSATITGKSLTLSVSKSGEFHVNIKTEGQPTPSGKNQAVCNVEPGGAEFVVIADKTGKITALNGKNGKSFDQHLICQLLVEAALEGMEQKSL